MSKPRGPRRYTKPDRSVYFLRRADGVGPIKIGCSIFTERRLAEVSQWSPEPLELLARVPGSPADERVLHKQFAAARLHHEWFDPVPALLSFIALAKQEGALPSRATIIAVTGPGADDELRIYTRAA